MAAEDRANTSGANKRFPDGFRILNGTQEYITYAEHSSVRVWPSDEADYYAPHRHSAIEIALCRKGEVIFMVDDRRISLAKGDMLFISPNHTHSMNSCEDSSRLLFLFEPDPLLTMRDFQPLKEWMDTPRVLRAGDKNAEAIADTLTRCAQCYSERPLLWNTRCYGFFMEMYAQLAMVKNEEELPGSESAKQSVNPELMNSAITFIEQNFRKNITLEEVAAFAGFSRFYFSRSFNSFTGLTFVEYLNRRRLNVADEMLLHTRKPVAEVARESGFRSLATFNRIFRQIHSCTPTRFRSIYGTYM